MSKIGKISKHALDSSLIYILQTTSLIRSSDGIYSKKKLGVAYQIAIHLMRKVTLSKLKVDNLQTSERTVAKNISVLTSKTFRKNSTVTSKKKSTGINFIASVFKLRRLSEQFPIYARKNAVQIGFIRKLGHWFLQEKIALK
jgi:hypothetical protein